MAERGEILVSTAIDTSGFETDARKLQQAAQRAADSVNNTFEELKSKLSKKDVLQMNYFEDRNGKGHTIYNDRDVVRAYDYIEANGGVVDSWNDIVDAMRDYKEDAAIAVSERKKQIKVAKEEKKVEKDSAQQKVKEVKEQKKATKASNGFGQSLKKGIGTLLKFALGLQALRAIFNSIKQMMKEGINNLVQVDKKLNKSMSAMKSSMTQLKNAIGTMVAPLIQMVEPFITKLLGWLTQAFNKAAELMAALAGQKTFKKAIAVQEDYAASVAKTQANLAGLDEIKTFDDNNGNANVEDMFKTAKVEEETLAIAGKIGKVIDDIKTKLSGIFAPLKEFDIAGFLGNLGSGLMGALSGAFTKLPELITSIDWEEVGGKVEKAIKSLVEGLFGGEEFEGFISGLFKSIGAVAGAALSFLDGFFSGLFEDFQTFWDSQLEKHKDELEECGDNLIEKIFKFSWLTNQDAASWVNEHILTPLMNGFLGTSAGQKVQKIYNEVKNWIDKIKEPFKNVVEWFKGLGLHETLGNMLHNAEVLFRGSFTVIKKLFEWLGEKLEPVVKAISDAVGGVWTKVTDWFGGLKDDIAGVLTDIVNVLIRGLNKVIKAPFDLLNSMTAKLKNFDVFGVKPFKDLKDIKVPVIPEISKTPKLATGAVIPPNAPFMAMLGDQKHGTNIEAPLDTIKEAVAEVVGAGGTYQFTAQINRRTLFDEIIEEGKVRRTATGRNPFAMA